MQSVTKMPAFVCGLNEVQGRKSSSSSSSCCSSAEAAATETGAAAAAWAWGHREVSNGIFVPLLTRDAITKHTHTHASANFACFYFEHFWVLFNEFFDVATFCAAFDSFFRIFFISLMQRSSRSVRRMRLSMDADGCQARDVLHTRNKQQGAREQKAQASRQGASRGTRCNHFFDTEPPSKVVVVCFLLPSLPLIGSAYVV